MKTSIGIVGMGTVGKAVFKGFSTTHILYGYDINTKLSLCKLEEVVQCDVIFLCLPTPSKSTGEADTSYIHNALSIITDHPDYNKSATFVLKSTVPIGTTSFLQQKYNINIIHCPEFLSEKTAEIDFLTTTRVIIGTNIIAEGNKIEKIFKDRFVNIHTIIVSPEESEFIKYCCNSFYATKITFFNEMRLLSDKLNLDWSKIMIGILSSGWIVSKHTDVPGSDGQYGFGGSCFPKDILALSYIFKQQKLNSILLNAVIQQNQNIRKEKNYD